VGRLIIQKKDAKLKKDWVYPVDGYQDARVEVGLVKPYKNKEKMPKTNMPRQAMQSDPKQWSRIK